ncbi:MAG: acyltransferase [Acidimicrobiales bacterium]|nr:acyltransferase [Acidimicrobiales bacterium]
MRTIAVYLVVAFHAGLGLFEGGYIGVDLFFVLSGYLVTQVLLRDLTESGRVRFDRFYARRARRILPAAVIVLSATAVAYRITASPAQAADAFAAVRSAFLYVSNWHFIRASTDYFATDINSNPVQHYWSLSVEEQFYLVWPLAVAALVALTSRTGRYRWWWMRGALAAGIVASAGLAVGISRSNLSRAYFGTDTRAYQLVAGALLAVSPSVITRMRRHAPWSRVMAGISVAGLVIVATPVFSRGPISRGLATTVLAVAALVAVEASAGGPVQRVLSWGPVAYLGRISYGVYLWHWPIIIIATLDHDIAPLPLFIGAALGATAIAAASYHLIETPIRFGTFFNRRRLPTIAVGLTVSVLGGLVLAPAVLKSGSTTIKSTTATPSNAPKLLDWRKARHDFAPYPECEEGPPADCAVTSGSGKTVVLMGDSLAWSFLPAFETLAEQRSWTLVPLISPACPWQRDIQIVFNTGFTKLCERRKARWYEDVLPVLKPDLIVAVGQSLDGTHKKLLAFPSGGGTWQEDSDYDEKLKAISEPSFDVLGELSREFVVIESYPELDGDPIDCLSKARDPRDCAQKVPRGPTPFEKELRRRSGTGSFLAIDADEWVCPALPRCDAVVNDVIVRMDGIHLTRTFARTLVPKLAAALPE